MEDSPWSKLWGIAYKKIVDIVTTPANGIGAQVWLESGEKKLSVQDLEAVGWEIVNRYQPKGETTYCNLALAHSAAAYGCFTLRGLMANDIVRSLATGSLDRWQLVAYPRAIDHALKGGLGLLGKAYPHHGHVALIAPRPGQHSPSWGVLCPIVFNVGKRNGLMKASEAFPVKEGMPQAWIYA